jgi:hypothetical protein
MSPEEIKNKTIAMRNGELPLLRDGEYWTDDERRRVQIMFEDGRPVNEIALELQRTERAVYQQISSMSLYVTAPEKMRKHRSGPKEPVCLCSVCSCDRSLCPRCEHYHTIQEEA